MKKLIIDEEHTCEKFWNNVNAIAHAGGKGRAGREEARREARTRSETIRGVDVLRWQSGTDRRMAWERSTLTRRADSLNVGTIHRRLVV